MRILVCVRVCRECAELPAFFVGRKVGEKSGRQRERISGRAGTPSGGILMVPEGGENTGRQRERISARARTPSGDTTKIP